MGARQRRRQTRSRRAAQGPVDRLWTVATARQTLAALLGLAGVLLIALAVDAAQPVLPANWWVSPLTGRAAVGLAAGVVAAALVLGLGALLGRDRRAAAEGDADFVVDAETAETIALPTRPWVPWAGAAVVIIGIGLAVGHWFALQSGLPSGRLVLTQGETAEHYMAAGAGQDFKITLPRRAHLAELRVPSRDDGGRASARLGFHGVGEEPAAGQKLEPGQSVDAQGFRFSFVGVEPSPGELVAVLRHTGEDAIAAAGRKGQTVRFELDGPTFRIAEITPNYMGVMGPAVKLAGDADEVWVFQRRVEPKLELESGLAHDIVVDRLQTAPAAVFAVSPVQPIWPVTAGGTLFVVGFALLLLVPERLVGPAREDGSRPVWSLSEAGPLAEAAPGEGSAEAAGSEEAA